MKAIALQHAMGNNITAERAAALIDGCNRAMILADCTTVNRAAMFLAQIREESVGLKYQQEIGSDAYLQGQPYWPFIGRTFIQITWNYNYAAFGTWCHERKQVADPQQFVKNPETLAEDAWAWIGPAWFWSTHGLNAFADNNDVKGATERINGGLNGYASRLAYWQHIHPMGDVLLPTDPHTPDSGGDHPIGDWFDMATQKDLEAAVRKVINEGAPGPHGNLRPWYELIANPRAIRKNMREIARQKKAGKK